jgi:hypothetical protein
MLLKLEEKKVILNNFISTLITISKCVLTTRIGLEED